MYIKTINNKFTLRRVGEYIYMYKVFFFLLTKGKEKKLHKIICILQFHFL